MGNLINNINPDEIYNLAAQSHVAVSFKNPMYTTSVGNNGTLTILEILRNLNKNIKYYQASSSEMFGGADKVLLSEESAFDPKSPYAASKVFHIILQNYIENLTESLQLMGYFLIMNLLIEAKPSLPEKYQELSQEFLLEYRKNLHLAT